MKINEIFKSISGEAARAGYPVIFIRTYGCNLRCGYCDTMYAVEGGEYTVMTPAQILYECLQLGVKRVVLTGGEPLIQPDAGQLIDLLCDNGFEVEVETNGAVDLGAFHLGLKTNRIDLLSYTMDYKTAGSGMIDKMVHGNLTFLGPKDVLKFVVCEGDLRDVKAILRTFDIQAQVFISPIFGQIEPKQIVEFILENKLYNCRVQLQMHKFIWDVNQRGV